MLYKITFGLSTPVIYSDLPTFDALLSFCYAREHLGNSFTQKINLSKEECEVFQNMPLLRHEKGWYYASWMQFDDNHKASYQDSFKKRWANKNDDIADFKKVARKVNIRGGEYKSYMIPYELVRLRECWFYFATNELSKVEHLIEKHLRGIGKKIGSGFGAFYDYKIEEHNVDNKEQYFIDNLLRPIPCDTPLENGVMMSWKPPYWAPCNIGICKTN